MATLVLCAKGSVPVGFTLHLRGADPFRRATEGTVLGTLVGGEPKCESWCGFDLWAERTPDRDREECVLIEPAPALLPEHGAALRRCLPLALASMPACFHCDPQDREDLMDDDPHHTMAFLEPRSYEATVAILGYFVLGFGARYPFYQEGSDHQALLSLIEGL